ncbi:putative Alpha/beta hydrolase fold-3 domain-containing protein [Seiridium cardinale]
MPDKDPILPHGAMLYSPAVYFTANAGQEYESYQNASEDILVPSLSQWAADEYLPQGNAEYEAQARPFLSPLHHPFKTRVPLFLHAGTKEAFYDSIKEFSEEMTRVPGNRIRLRKTELAPHDILLLIRCWALHPKLRQPSGTPVISSQT